jgi:hypothetical protein
LLYFPPLSFVIPAALVCHSRRESAFALAFACFAADEPHPQWPGQCPVFSSFEAAAAFCVALFVALLWVPGSGLQLPLVPGVLPGVGSKPGQQGLPLLADFFADFFKGDFFAVVMSR